jgi:hypothetical protein
VITRGLITQRSIDEQLPAQTIERDYVLANICADLGALGNERLVFKGGTLLRLCYFQDHRYSADLDFSAIEGLTAADAIAAVATAVDACRRRIEAPTLMVSDADGGTAWISYVGPLGSRPRKIKLNISDDELVEGHHRLRLYHGGPINRPTPRSRATPSTKWGPRSCGASPNAFSAATSTTSTSCSTVSTSTPWRSGICTCERRPTT